MPQLEPPAPAQQQAGPGSARVGVPRAAAGLAAEASTLAGARPGVIRVQGGALGAEAAGDVPVAAGVEGAVSLAAGAGGLAGVPGPHEAGRVEVALGRRAVGEELTPGIIPTPLRRANHLQIIKLMKKSGCVGYFIYSHLHAFAVSGRRNRHGRPLSSDAFPPHLAQCPGAGRRDVFKGQANHRE